MKVRAPAALDFEGRTVLVTGASKGIGAACAHLFGKGGARVAVHFHEDAAGAEGVVAAIRRAGGEARAFAADLRHWDAGEALVQVVADHFGGLDVAILNHGIWKEASIQTMTAADYEETFDANLRGYFSVAGAAARRMTTGGGGHLVFVASTAGQRGEAFHAHYAAAKGAVISLTKSLAVELAPAGIRVNCVAPGWVQTPMTEPTLADPAAYGRVVSTIPLGRVGTPEEIAGPVAFVCSPLAGFVTGEIFNVNGGAVLVG